MKGCWSSTKASSAYEIDDPVFSALKSIYVQDYIYLLLSHPSVAGLTVVDGIFDVF